MFKNVKYFPSNTNVGKFDFKRFDEVKRKEPTPIKGSGLVDVLTGNVTNLIPTISTAASSVNSTELNSIYDGLSFLKKVAETNEYPGETHAVLKVGNNPDGTSIFKKAQYQGPGTHLDTRLAKGDRPLAVPGDIAAKIHDMEFSLHEGKADIRKADENFLKNSKRDGDYMINKAQNKLINLKTGLEDLGLVSPAKFAGDGKISLTKRQISSYERELVVMKRQGYVVGFGASSKSKWNDKDVKNYKKSKKKKPSDRLRESVLGPRKTAKSKIPQKFRDRIDEEMRINKLLNDEEVPDNVLDALGMM